MAALALFRPEENARRFNQSAERLAMPALPGGAVHRGRRAAGPAPTPTGSRDGDGSLYLRPFMFANEIFLGVKPSSEYLFSVIASPVGAYFKGGDRRSRSGSRDDYTRAAPGGTGAAKCGGNYAAQPARPGRSDAARLRPGRVPRRRRAQWIEELGGMNIFFVFDDGSIVTPPLGGTILPGITRASIMTLAKDKGIKVREERYSFDQWQADAQQRQPARGLRLRHRRGDRRSAR